MTYTSQSIRPLSYGVFLLLLLLTACKDDTPPQPSIDPGVFELNILPVVRGQLFEQDFAYENAEGRRFSLNQARFYLSDITLVREDGSDTLVSEIELVDLADAGLGKTQHGSGVFIQYAMEPGNYRGIKFAFGVKPSLNHQDPQQYERTHPLSTEQGMHWSQSAGYRFLQLEGAIDSSQSKTGSIDFPLSYQMGLDPLYREIAYLADADAFEIVQKEELQFSIELDLSRIFFNAQDTIDMVLHPATESLPPNSPAFELAETLMDNLVGNSLFKVPF